MWLWPLPSSSISIVMLAFVLGGSAETVPEAESKAKSSGYAKYVWIGGGVVSLSAVSVAVLSRSKSPPPPPPSDIEALGSTADIRPPVLSPLATSPFASPAIAFKTRFKQRVEEAREKIMGDRTDGGLARPTTPSEVRSGETEPVAEKTEGPGASHGSRRKKKAKKHRK